MKVYMTCDMEGATGVVAWEQCTRAEPAYADARRLLLSDVNAAIAGAFDGGATEVIVADVHGGSRHIPFADVDPRARVVVGVPQEGPRFPFLDSSFGAFFCIAYHAMAETPHAVLCHTMTLEWLQFAVNGRPCGELGIDAALAGAVGVPTVLVTGDNCLCAEARAFLGDVETAEVKHALDYHRALCLSAGRSAALIHEKAVAAIAKAKEIKPFDFGSPATVTIRHRTMEAADYAARAPRAQRDDPLTVRFEYTRFEEHYGGTWEQKAR